jgi:hypothetical protein
MNALCRFDRLAPCPASTRSLPISRARRLFAPFANRSRTVHHGNSVRLASLDHLAGMWSVSETLGARVARRRTPRLAEPTPEEASALELAERLGWAIYRQDVASARGTDAMMALANGAPDPRVRGWVTLETETGFDVQFVAPAESGLDVIYRVAVPLPGEPLASLVQPPAPASPEAQRRFRARHTVLRRGFPLCKDRYNTVVLPAELLGERGLLVYALAATTDPREAVLGGHYRFLVSEDGTSVIKEQPLSKDCMSAELHRDQVALAVTSLVMPHPNEAHYFASLLYRTPLHVAAGGKLWQVDPGRYGGS